MTWKVPLAFVHASDPPSRSALRYGSRSQSSEIEFQGLLIQRDARGLSRRGWAHGHPRHPPESAQLLVRGAPVAHRWRKLRDHDLVAGAVDGEHWRQAAWLPEVAHDERRRAPHQGARRRGPVSPRVCVHREHVDLIATCTGRGRRCAGRLACGRWSRPGQANAAVDHLPEVEAVLLGIDEPVDRGRPRPELDERAVAIRNPGNRERAVREPDAREARVPAVHIPDPGAERVELEAVGRVDERSIRGHVGVDPGPLHGVDGRRRANERSSEVGHLGLDEVTHDCAADTLVGRGVLLLPPDAGAVVPGGRGSRTVTGVAKTWPAGSNW